MINRFLVVSCVLATLTCLCTKKKSDNQEYYILDTDTLTFSQINELDPVKKTDSIKIQNVLIRKALASVNITEVNDSLLKILSDQLSRQSEVEWSDSASVLFQKASQVIIRKVVLGVEPADIIEYADSLLFEKYAVKIPEHSNIVIATGNNVSEQAVALVQRLLGVSAQVAHVVYSFEDDLGDSTLNEKNVNEMVRGLLFANDTVTQKVKPERKHISPPKDNSLLALEYRSHKSIQDSIAVHIPNLVNMYKQFLKKDVNFSGVVIVVFRVSANGEVADVHVSRSSIQNNEFLGELILYAKTIRFSLIPENIGNMTFEFPFEFNAEM